MSMTDVQLATLEIGQEQATPRSASRGPICQWSYLPSGPDDPSIGYLVEFIVNRDVQQFLELPGRTRPITVAGFPAVETDFLALGNPRPGS